MGLSIHCANSNHTKCLGSEHHRLSGTIETRVCGSPDCGCPCHKPLTVTQRVRIKPDSPPSTYWDNRQGEVIQERTNTAPRFQVAIVEVTLRSGRKIKWIGDTRYLEVIS